MRTGFVVLSVGLTAALGAAPVRAQDTQVRLTGRVQVQYNTTSVDEADVGADAATASIAASTFETRRVRLGVRLTVDEWITGLLEPEYALGSLTLRQVWMNLGIDPAFELRIGQFKKPFSLIQLTSSLETSAIERGLRIREIGDAWLESDAGPGNVLVGLDGEAILGEEQYLLDLFGYMGYELGAAAHGELGPVSYEVGVFNGTGADARDRNDAKSYAGRLVWAVPTGVPVALGAAVSYHELGTTSAGRTLDGTAFELDVELGEFRRDGLHVIAEATTGDNIATDESFLAAQAMASWFSPTRGRVEGIEPLFRVSWGDPDREVEEDAAMLLTPGVNLYFSGRNRLQLNWDFFVPQGDRFETHHALRAQAQLAF